MWWPFAAGLSAGVLFGFVVGVATIIFAWSSYELTAIKKRRIRIAGRLYTLYPLAEDRPDNGAVKLL